MARTMPRLRLLCCSLATTEVGEYEAGIYDCHFCDGECGGCFTAHLCDVVALLRGGRAKGGDRRGRSGPFTLLQDGDRERVASAPSSRAYPPHPAFLCSRCAFGLSEPRRRGMVRALPSTVVGEVERRPLSPRLCITDD